MAQPQSGKHLHHHILPYPAAIGLGFTLFCLTIVTVWVAGIDLGALNFVVAFFIASVKATLVMLFFMNLFWDRKENGGIFATSFIFLAIFIVLTSMDLFFRGNVYLKPGELEARASAGGTHLKTPWISTPELIKQGHEKFQLLCTPCHGPQGEGNGPAAASLNPKPRNFTKAEGWKNGRKIYQIYNTVTHGLGGMPSFASEPSDERWALAHYVQSLGPKVEPATEAEVKAAGIDTTGGAAGGGEPTIPIQQAMDAIAVPDDKK